MQNLLYVYTRGATNKDITDVLARCMLITNMWPLCHAPLVYTKIQKKSFIWDHFSITFVIHIWFLHFPFFGIWVQFNLFWWLLTVLWHCVVIFFTISHTQAQFNALFPLPLHFNHQRNNDIPDFPYIYILVEQLLRDWCSSVMLHALDTPSPPTPTSPTPPQKLLH